MSNKKQIYLIYITALSAGTLLISNIAAIKLWDFFGIAVDGGVVLFPITYVLGDLIVEFYGKKIAKNIVLSSFMVNIIALVVFYAVIALPPYPDWGLQDAYMSVLGFSPRIIIGSLLAYVVSNLCNNFIFVKLKEQDNVFANSFFVRALSSSAVARIFDCLIFETIAFLGVLSFHDFLIQAVFAYVMGIAFEIIFSPLEVYIVHTIRRKHERI